MPTVRGASKNADLLESSMQNYLLRIKGRKFTLRSFTRTLNEDGYTKSNTISNSTIWGDLQYEPIIETQNNEGKQITADAMFYTFTKYTINDEDEITHPSGSKWKIVSKIENEDVGEDKPYVGYAVKRLPKKTL